MTTELEKMMTGQEYSGLDEKLKSLRNTSNEICLEYNGTLDDKRRKELLVKLLSKESELPTLEGPIHITYGFCTSFGKNCYANFNLTILDHGTVTVGNNVMIGPGCTIVTAVHPIKAEERIVKTNENGRNYDVETARPVIIEDNCWIGASVTICPGVRIGKASVILPGSVVTKDIPANVIASGVPCRTMRDIY